MKNIALYASNMQAGKTTVANYLVQEYGYIKLKSAKVLKDMLSVFLTNFVDDPYEYIEGSKKEDIIPGLGVSTRYLMQTLGTEWGRELVSINVWTDVVFNNLDPARNYVIDDMRFPNEFEQAGERGFVRIKLVGYGSLIGSQHPSEGSLEGYPFEHVIHNNGTVDELLGQVLYVISDKFNA